MPAAHGQRQCIAGVALPAVPRQSGSVLQEYICPLAQAAGHCNAGVALPAAPRGAEAVRCKRSTLCCPEALR